jgi:membrane protein YdbS with pleckstrin-like domain
LQRDSIGRRQVFCAALLERRLPVPGVLRQGHCRCSARTPPIRRKPGAGREAFDVPNGIAGIAHRDELHPDRRSYVIGPLGMGIVEFMARYIDDILQPGEKVLYSTNAHWTFYVPAIVTWVAAIIVFILSRSTTGEWLVLLYLGAAALLALVALYLTVKAWFHRWTTETDVTNLRVVHKTGFIQRRTFEIALDKVESVDVNQSMLGRILNYGNVTIKGIGEGRETISAIASPLQFRNHITAR